MAKPIPAAKNEGQAALAKGRPTRSVDPNAVVIVGKGHPLANELYFRRNDTKYTAEDASVKSFVAQGQLQPIGVFPYKNESTGQDEMVVFFGNQRTLMARAGGINIEVAIFSDYTVEQAAAANAIENAQRTDLSVIDLLMAVRRSVARHKAAKTKNVYGAVAAEFGRGSHQWARDMQSVSQLPATIMKSLSAGTLGMTQAIEIAKLDSEEEQLALFKSLKGDEASVNKKGQVKVKDVKEKVKGGSPKDTLSKKEWRIISTDELVDSDTRILIRAVLGDIDINEAQRAGLVFVKHQDKPTKKGKKGKTVTPAAAVDISNLLLDDEDDEDFEDDDE